MRSLKISKKETKHSGGGGGGVPSSAILLLYSLLFVSILFAVQNMKDTVLSQEFRTETHDVNSDMPTTTTTLHRIDNNKRFSHRNYTYSPTEDRSLLAELTQSPPFGSLECPPWTTPIYDRIINNEETNDTTRMMPKKKPNIVHLSFTSRCVGEVFANSVQQWKESLPDHSIYFHDDQAVERLFQQEWREFPDLQKKMQCIKYKGAMTVDVWRILVVYRFGGIYSDIDNVPPAFFQNGTMINPDDTFFATLDSFMRPLQNTFAMEPQHPIAVFTMETILKNLMAMESLRKPKTVFVTGPQALFEGCTKYTGAGGCNQAGIHTGQFLGKKVHLENMIATGQGWGNPMNGEMVEYKGRNLTKKEVSLHLGGLRHWEKVKFKNKVGKDFSCREYLYRVDHPSKENDITGNWSLNEEYAFGVT